MARMSIVRCSIHFSLLAAGVGGWVVSCYNLCEDYWPNIARGADTNTRDDTQGPWSAGWKLCEKYKYARELIPYDSIASVGKTGVWWRADFQSGSRVLKKVFWTLSYIYLWHTMWFHAKKLLKTLIFWKSLNSLCKSGSRPQKSPKKAQKTDHSIAIYSNFWIVMVYFGYHLVKAHVQAVQNMYGKGG